MYELTKEFRFEASHQLKHHDGKCARLHGHSWVGRITIQSSRLEREGPKQNMVMDFGDIKAALQPLVDEFLDHWHLNETLMCDSPTSEYVAMWIFKRLEDKLPGLASVEIHETCTSACRYIPA